LLLHMHIITMSITVRDYTKTLRKWYANGTWTGHDTNDNEIISCATII